MTHRALRIVNFGKSRTGLATIGYVILNTDGTTQAARATSGIYEMIAGSGIYAVNVTFPNTFQGSILWDTGESAGRILYAAEEFSYLQATALPISGSVIVSCGVTLGSSTTNIHTDIIAVDHFYDSYTVRINDPVSGSASRPVDEFLAASGTFILDPALPFIPTSGSQLFVLTAFNDKSFLGQVG